MTLRQAQGKTTRKSANILLVALTAALLVAALVFFVSPKMVTPEPTGSDPVGEEGRWRKPGDTMPEPLDLVFADELPPLDFNCPTLRVPESVQAAKTDITDEIANANARGEVLRSRISFPLEIERGREDEKYVALTIDTGTQGGYGVSELLDIAAHYDIPLTFFLTGCWTMENPELAQRIVAEGHTLAHHSLTHANLGQTSDEMIVREFDETTRIIEETTGIRPAIFRKPHYAGGEAITAAAGERGMVSVQGWPDWGDTTGWRSETTVEAVLARIRSVTAPGAIWVFHNLALTDLNAFEDIVRYLVENGYELVRVEDIIP